MKAGLILCLALTSPASTQTMSWRIEAAMFSWPDKWRNRPADKPFFGITAASASNIKDKGTEQLSFSKESPSFDRI